MKIYIGVATGVVGLLVLGFFLYKPVVLRTLPADSGASLASARQNALPTFEKEVKEEEGSTSTSKEETGEISRATELVVEGSTEAVPEKQPVNKEAEDEVVSEDHLDEINEPKEEEAPVDTLKIIDMPLPETSSEPRGQSPVTHIMLHFTSDVIQNPDNPYKVERAHAIFAEYGVGSHYLVARDGTIYRFINESSIAYHAGLGTLAGLPAYTNNMNKYSIGIEILAIGTEAEMSGFIGAGAYGFLPDSAIGYTSAQYDSLRLLLADVAERNVISFDRTHIIGHDDYAPDRKTDPGSLFDWSRVGL